jgi:hypothetical protein
MLGVSTPATERRFGRVSYIEWRSQEWPDQQNSAKWLTVASRIGGRVVLRLRGGLIPPAQVTPDSHS